MIQPKTHGLLFISDMLKRGINSQVRKNLRKNFEKCLYMLVRVAYWILGFYLNQDASSSNPTECLDKLRNPTSLQGSWWSLRLLVTFELKPKLNAMISISRMRLSPQNLSKVGRATVQVLNWIMKTE